MTAGNREPPQVRGYTPLERIRGARRAFRARREADGLRVVVKAADVSDPFDARRLRHEADVLSHLAGLDVPTVVERVSEGGAVVALVLRDEGGQNLEDRIASAGRLAEDEVITLGEKLASALASLHERDVIHRDVKPANVLVDGERLVLIDFELAKLNARPAPLAPDGAALGTPRYMAPEQLRDGEDVDERADVWALGVVLYKMATGDCPFQDAQAGGLFSKIMRQSPPAAPELTGGLELFVRRCLAKDRSDRPSARQAEAELRSLSPSR